MVIKNGSEGKGRVGKVKERERKGREGEGRKYVCCTYFSCGAMKA